MAELVPFQTKRRKTFPPGTSREIAIKSELTKHFKKKYAELSFGTTEILPNRETTTFGHQPVTTDPSLETLVTRYIEATLEPSLPALETLMLVLRALARNLAIKRPYQILPKPYQKELRLLYAAQSTLDHLADQLKSKKRAKKYLRVLNKRIGFYTKEKTTVHKCLSI